MRFSSSGFVKGVVAAIVLAGVIYGVRHFGFFASEDANDPAVLSRRAMEALEAVKNRRPGDRRPASYDAVLAPLDALLAQARTMLSAPDFNPATDLPALRARVAPVMDIAGLADRQAQTETGPLASRLRFNDQKGEAAQYLAAALWKKANAEAQAGGYAADESARIPLADLNEIKRVLDVGLGAAPGNRELWYIRAVINRAEGLFTAAARDLERSIEISPGYAAAWNMLGLVRISLWQFDEAEAALEKARTLALDTAKRLNYADPGDEYTAIIFNLASFHDNLALFHARENRTNPTLESQRRLERHASEARRYYTEYLARIPPNSEEARFARQRLEALPE